MAKHLSLTSPAPKASVYLCLFLLAITIGFATSARILDELDTSKPIPAVIEPIPSSDDDFDISSPPVPSPYVGPVESNLTPTPIAHNVAPVAGPAPADMAATGSATIPPTSVVGSTATTPVSTGATEANTDNHSHPSLSFFMHDIVGGSSSSAMVIPGIAASSGVSGNNDDLNNNNLPLPSMEELGGTSTTNIQNNDSNNVVNVGNNLPFVSGGHLPAGATLGKPIFGSITVIDEELTEGHELGSSVLGRAQGFYLATSLDGSSQTMAVTALFHGVGDHNEEEDTISFFGVHRTAGLESQIAIVGGTGKYENAKGYATIQTQHQVDQHMKDGVETLLQFNVYLTV